MTMDKRFSNASVSTGWLKRKVAATRFSAGSRGSTWNSDEASAAANGAVTKRPSRLSRRMWPGKNPRSKRIA